MDRRSFLALTGASLGVILLPAVRGSPAVADGLHRRAQALAARARSKRPTDTLSDATDLLMVAGAAAVSVTGAPQRRSLHRTASLSALVAAMAAQRAERSAGDLLVRALDHANGAGDGPLRAQALMLRRDEDGVAGHLVGAGSDASITLLGAALNAAGPSRDTASLRASIHYRLAWERAALGDVHGALQELEGADACMELAQPAPDHVEDVDLRGGGAAARRGKALRAAGCPAEAEAALAEALSTRLHPAGALVDLAKVRAAAGDVEGAAAALEDSFLVARTVENRQVETRARTVATALPDCAAVRSLKDLLRS